MSITTTESINPANKKFRCDYCKAAVDVVFERPDRRRVCVDCLPERERAVLGVAEGEDSDA